MIVDIDFGPVTVLVVDGNAYGRAFLRSALQSFGVRRVVEAADGDAAVAALEAERIDVVLVDAEVAPAGGTELTRSLRRGRVAGRAAVPVVMLSEAAEPAAVAAARAAGITELLVKPASAESLYRRLRDALVNPRPFVAAESYVGPCRRTVALVPPDQGERRTSPPLPAPPPLVAVPPGVAHSMVRRAQAEAQLADRQDGSDRILYRHFKAGESIFAEGAPGDEAYVIQRGRVAIEKEVGGQPVRLGEVAAAGVFGEMALIDGEPRMAAARAIEDTTCLAISKAALKAQLNRTPDLVILVVETLLHDIRKMGRELVEARSRIRVRREGGD
ncbi:cyclic nucleotide-binding domain-containing protein [Magnetospirillum sp. UT-4]|uniref:cyclic nucleotide-binding domain-containing protein n=1 Tax=Magnetospirillum sp. UT-4 TaxID=2681467 RepID=UPI00137ED867|nr:cyclic nucleotide-binding domain-containing protein [Magnetospirillum sp. UT-4]CAA7611706.1 CheY-like receiver [Magnetospirillum sp. UT-4]